MFDLRIIIIGPMSLSVHQSNIAYGNEKVSKSMYMQLN